MLWVVREGGHSHEHQALVDSCHLAFPQRRDFGLSLSDGRREDGAIASLPLGSTLRGRSVQAFRWFLVLASWLQIAVGQPV